jgi:hypothetical protein
VKKKAGRGRRKDQPVRTVPMSGRTQQALKEQTAAFMEKFGREPGPNEPLFFDPDSDDEPRPMTATQVEEVQNEFVEALAKIGIDPKIIYACRRTGLLPSTETWHLLTEEQKDDWEAALDEYDERAKARH